MTNIKPRITATLVAEDDRSDFLPEHLGLLPSLRFESQVYSTASQFAREYGGGMWEFFELDNGGFYMAPSDDKTFQFANEMNSSDVQLSPDALGIVCCMYALSLLSFGPGGEGFGKKYHQLYEFALEHAESGAIFAAID